jgi:hypothetical protein
MNTFLEFAIVGAWVYVSVMALTRVFTERRRWQRQMSRRSERDQNVIRNVSAGKSPAPTVSFKYNAPAARERL